MLLRQALVGPPLLRTGFDSLKTEKRLGFGLRYNSEIRFKNEKLVTGFWVRNDTYVKILVVRKNLISLCWYKWGQTWLVKVQTVPPTHPLTIPCQALKVEMGLSKVMTIVQVEVAVGTIRFKVPSWPLLQVLPREVTVSHVAPSVPWQESNPRSVRKSNIVQVQQCYQQKCLDLNDYLSSVSLFIFIIEITHTVNALLLWKERKMNRDRQFRMYFSKV